MEKDSIGENYVRFKITASGHVQYITEGAFTSSAAWRASATWARI